MRRRLREKVPAIIFFCILILVGLSFIVMLLWNAILPDIVNAGTISFWQSMGLLVLAKILFGGFGGWRHKRQHWRERMHEKWQAMTPEEKEKFKEEWKTRCNWRNRFRGEAPMQGERGAEPGS